MPELANEYSIGGCEIAQIAEVRNLGAFRSEEVT
jgi:hypothetical protein